MSDRVRIGLTGDVMLGRNVDRRQRHPSREPAAVWGDVCERLRSLDALVINLECCLSTRGEPWERTYRPFHFRADPSWAIPALEAAGVDCCALANNHVLDFEEPALVDTLDHLDEVGIARAGAGRTLDEALEPAVFEVDGGDDAGDDAGDDGEWTGDPGGTDGLSIAVVSLTDNTPEYGAGADEPGTAHVDIDVDDERTRTRVETAMERARGAEPDLLVASLHWGPNMVTEPPPSFESFGRWLVDRGVDVVHGHSAHVFQGIEVHDGAPILYDAGDFVDDYAVDRELRNDRGFLFELHLDDDAVPAELRLVPTEIRDCSVHLADGDTATWSRERIRERSSPYGTTFERDGEELVLAL